MEKLVVHNFHHFSAGGSHRRNICDFTDVAAGCLQRPGGIIDGPAIRNLSRPAAPSRFAQIAAGRNFDAFSRHLPAMSQRGLARFT